LGARLGNFWLVVGGSLYHSLSWWYY